MKAHPLRLFAVLMLVLCDGVLNSAFAQVQFVTEDDAEFITSGDFNGDGRTDVLVVDRATGNARVGYQGASGDLAWTQPMPTGVPGPTSLAAGNFFGSNRTAVAVASFDHNRVTVLDLVTSNLVGKAFPKGTPSGLLARYRPAATPVQAPDWVCAGADRDPGITIVELFDYLGDSLLHRNNSRSVPGRFDHGNTLQFAPGEESLVVAMQRGSNDTFVALSFSNGFNAVLTRSNLPVGSRYAFGRFNSEALPRFIFYVPGQSNVTVQRVFSAEGAFQFDAPTVTAFTSAVQRVYVVDEQTNSLVVVRFGDGVVGARLPSGNDSISGTYRFGAGTNGVPLAAISLGNSRFALLNGASNGVGSVSSEVYQLTGANYVRTSSSALPKPSTSASRANVWLFATEPFVTSPAVFVSSLNAGAWVNSVSGLPGSLNVISEQDRGTSAGLGDPTAQTLATPPNTAVHALANQYHPAISLFSYSSARPPQPSLVIISPPPGHYAGPVTIAFSTSNSTDTVYYRMGGTGSFDAYAAPFALGTNTQVQFYGQALAGSERSLLQVASYTFGNSSFAPLVTTNGTGTNNIPEPPQPPGATSGIPHYAYGTVFYSRRTGTNGAIWSVTLDGLSDHYITEGTRPRISPDGRHLAFLRGGRPFDTIPQDNGSIWIRDLLTGSERLLVARTNLIVGFDWEYANTNLVFDHGCGLFRADLAGNITALPLTTTCPEDAPSVSPVDGRLAFHAVAPLETNYGIYVTDSAVSTKQYLPLPLVKPRRPAWAPDGVQLALADYAFTYLPESGMNLFVVNPDGSGLHQITGFTEIEGFREGALWTPAADGLVGAATIDGVNGIWLVPLSADRTHCESPPVRLSTLPGDDIDFVGSIFVPPGPPRVKIRREGPDAIVSWKRTAWPYVLQAAADPTPEANWQDIAPPYSVAGRDYEVRITNIAAFSKTFFRLRL